MPITSGRSRLPLFPGVLQNLLYETCAPVFSDKSVSWSFMGQIVLKIKFLALKPAPPTSWPAETGVDEDIGLGTPLTSYISRKTSRGCVGELPSSAGYT